MEGSAVGEEQGELEVFERALRGVQGHYLQTERTRRRWRLRVVDVDETSVMLGQEGAANLYRGACLADVFRALMPVTRAPDWSVNGERVGRASMVWLGPGEEFSIRAHSRARWLAVSIPASHVRRWLEQHEAVGSPPAGTVLEVQIGALERVMRLVRCLMAERGAVDGPPPSPSLRSCRAEELLGAIMAAVVTRRGSAGGKRGRPRLPRQEILHRVARLIDVGIDRPLLIDDLCKAAGVSSRTLHTMFTEQLGISPHQYVMLLRLHAIHKALFAAQPGETITAVCCRFNVWDFGRFARDYKHHFGRSPSEAFHQGRALDGAMPRAGRRGSGGSPSAARPVVAPARSLR